MVAEVLINQLSDVLAYHIDTVRHSLHHCSPRYYLSLQAGLEMRKKLRSTFFHSERRVLMECRQFKGEVKTKQSQLKI